MTQRALKKKSGSVRPSQQSYIEVGLGDYGDHHHAWDDNNCTYTFGSTHQQQGLHYLSLSCAAAANNPNYYSEQIDSNNNHSNNSCRAHPSLVRPVVKNSPSQSRSAEADPDFCSSTGLLPSKSSGGVGSWKGPGIFSLFKLKKNKQNSTPRSVDNSNSNRVTLNHPATTTTTTTTSLIENGRALSSSSSSSPVAVSDHDHHHHHPVLHLKRTTVRNNATGKNEEHFAIVPADKLLTVGNKEGNHKNNNINNNVSSSSIATLSGSSRRYEESVVFFDGPTEEEERLTRLKSRPGGDENNDITDKTKAPNNNDSYAEEESPNHYNETKQIFNRNLFDKQLIQLSDSSWVHSSLVQKEKRANRYLLSQRQGGEEEPEEEDSGKGPSLGNNSTSDESSVLNSLDISGYIEWEDDNTDLAGGPYRYNHHHNNNRSSNTMDVKRRSVSGAYDMSLAYPPNGAAAHFSTMPNRLSGMSFYASSPHLIDPRGVPIYANPGVIYKTPTIKSATHTRKVLKPSSEFILVGPYEAPSPSLDISSDGRAPSSSGSMYSSTLSLAKSRGKFSSMPSLNILNNNNNNKKESKKLMKSLKKEKKKEEKLEKKREKEEKKERKKWEKEMRKSGQTLPRNWEYVNKPIEIVYERPRKDWKLTPVPISLEDEPIYQVPKKTGINPKMVHYASTPDLQRVEQVYGPSTIINDKTTDDYSHKNDESDYAPRAVVLRRGPNGFGFVLRGAKCDSPDFQPPPHDAPAMQYLDTVDKGSVADKAGLKGGDFILEINGQNVTRASHEYVVSLIKSSGHTLTMNVLSVKPTERDQNWYVHQDGSMTLPHRRKQAPEPPRRDPKTSLSFSKAKSKSFAEGMAEIEKLDQALAEYDVSDTPSGESAYSSGARANGAEMKTASIRAGYAKKRVSSVELENLCRSDSPHKPEHLSPSEVRIKKYHKKQSNLEKSQSTPNLAQNPEEVQPEPNPMMNVNQPMYRTVASSGPSDYSPYSSSCSSGPSKYNQRLYPVPYMGNLPTTSPGMDVSGCRHSVAIGSNVQVNSLPSHARGKARPIAPPVIGPGSAPSSKQPAPAPPPQLVKINTNTEQPVYASVVNGAVQNPNKPNGPDANPYESSFRPGTVAMFGNKNPAVVTPSTLSQVKLRNSKQNPNNIPNESASQQHAMLVMADVHNSSLNAKDKHRSQQPFYEPEPDYDSEHEEETTKHKTVISVNSNSGSNGLSASNGYATLQPPANGANPPIYSIPHQKQSFVGPSTLPSPDQISLGVGTPINIMPTKSPSSSSSSSYKSTSESKIPTPPPAPPLQFEAHPQVIPPPPQFCPPQPVASNKTTSDNSNEFLNEIKRAANERKNRSKDIEAEEKSRVDQSAKNQSPMDKTQAAILQAVAKRRTMLEQSDKDIVVNQIEAQIQKTKQFQSAKYYNSGNGLKKEVEVLSENKDPPRPATKPSKQVAPVSKPLAPAKPKMAFDKVQSKPPAPKITPTPVATAYSAPKEAKVTPPVSTLSMSNKTTAEKSKVMEDEKLKEIVKTNLSVVKVTDQAKVTETPKPQNDSTESGEEDFLKKAEKARQMYLQRKSGTANTTSATSSTTNAAISASPVDTTSSNNNVAATTNSNNSIPKLAPTINGETKTVSAQSKTVQKMNKTNAESSKKTTAAPVAKPQLSNGNTKSHRMHIEVQSAGNLTNVNKVGNVSIKDRIASLQSSQQGNPDATKLITLKGVTTSHSHTDPFNSSDSCSTPNDSPYHEMTIVAPPPGFSDNDQSTPVETFNRLQHLHVLSAPLSELSISTVPPYDGRAATDHLAPQDDSLSLISSLSTLSTLSTSSMEHPIEIVPPPPSGFEDKASPVSTDQGFEESFIPPPPQFDAATRNVASTKNSFRNKPVEDWFYVDVLDWLESVQMQQYKVNFANQCIDGKKLLNLKRNDYITLGVTQVGHRMNLERSIKKLAMAGQQKVHH